MPNGPNITANIVSWEKPQIGRLKLNANAAIDQSNGVMGFGWILRDHNGVFLVAENKWVHGIYSAKKAEAISMCEALSQLKDTGLGEVDIETDSQLVFKAMSSPKFISSFGLLVGDIKELASLINDVEFHFVK